MTTREDLMRQKCSLVMDEDFIDNVKLAQLLIEDPFLGVVVTKEDTVYAIGTDKNDYFGLGTVNEIPRLTKVEQLCGQNITTFAIGHDYAHILALSAGGVVYAWGRNCWGQLGDGSTTDSSVPVGVAGDLTDRKIQQIGCGIAFSVALTDDGKIFSWGSNKGGRSGLGTLDEDSTTLPKLVDGIAQRIISCSTGGGGVMCLTDRGKLFTFGFNGGGQLGVGTTQHAPTPIQVGIKAGYWIERVACGRDHSLALTNNGLLFTWGCNKHGEIGNGTTSNMTSPSQINFSIDKHFDIHVMDIWIEENTSFARGIHGDVYIWGEVKDANGYKSELTRPKKSIQVLPTLDISLFLSHFGAHGDSLFRAFNDRSSSDVTITVHGRDIHVHRVILQYRSRYFRNMFENDWKEKQEGKIVITQYSYDVYRTFLRYLYSGKLEQLQLKQIPLLLDLARCVLDDRLCYLCMERVKRTLKFDNVAQLFSMSISMRQEDLTDYCVRFAMRGLERVLDSDGFEQIASVDHVREFFKLCRKRGDFIVKADS